MYLPRESVETLDKVKVKAGLESARPRYDTPAVLRAAAIKLGINPQDANHLGTFISNMENDLLPQVTCIRCGKVGAKKRATLVSDPWSLLKDLSEIDGRLKPLFPILRRDRRINQTIDPDVVIYNGFCSVCIHAMDKNIPAILKFDIPQEDEFISLQYLVVELVRIGAGNEAVYDLEKLLRQHQGLES